MPVIGLLFPSQFSEMPSVGSCVICGWVLDPEAADWTSTPRTPSLYDIGGVRGIDEAHSICLDILFSARQTLHAETVEHHILWRCLAESAVLRREIKTSYIPHVTDVELVYAINFLLEERTLSLPSGHPIQFFLEQSDMGLWHSLLDQVDTILSAVALPASSLSASDAWPLVSRQVWRRLLRRLPLDVVDSCRRPVRDILNSLANLEAVVQSALHGIRLAQAPLHGQLLGDSHQQYLARTLQSENLQEVNIGEICCPTTTLTIHYRQYAESRFVSGIGMGDYFAGYTTSHRALLHVDYGTVIYVVYNWHGLINLHVNVDEVESLITGRCFCYTLKLTEHLIGSFNVSLQTHAEEQI